MRKILVISTLILGSASTAFASDAEDICGQLSMSSEQIMNARLEGVSIIDSMKAAGEGDNPSSRLLKLTVREAYSEPAYTGENEKQTAIKEFGIKKYLECMDYLNK